jgi:excinuclease ABC subunit C
VPAVPVAVTRLPVLPGVYRFSAGDGTTLYLGRATQLRGRVASYWSDLRDRPHLGAMVARIRRVEAVVCDSVAEATWLERNLLEAALPPWNRTAGGQETEVYLRLDERPASPGLSVAHLRQPAAGVRHFGPYLGGLRARQAVSGLERILPLSYSGASAAGTRRDLARVRGYDDIDRAGLVAKIESVLQRDADAVRWARGELELLRTKAAGLLAFELAGRIQGELQALDWVTDPQRVTTSDNTDFEVAGWSDGMSVRFEIRAGRLRGWKARPCPLADVAGEVALTPASWADFAERNARLAARLAQPC